MIYMIGGAGNGNFGDELIVRRWLAFLRDRGVEAVVCDENYARIGRDFHGPRFPGVSFVEAVSLSLIHI